MKKWLMVLAAALLVLSAAAAGLWYFMQQPLYQPGLVRAGRNLRAPLTPPVQTGAADFWRVEPDVQLYHFTSGTGRPVLVVHGGPGFPSTQPWSGLAPLTDRYQFSYYDQRGCGRSTRPVDVFTSSNTYENMTALDQALGLGAQIADIERIRQILGEEKLILIGHSFGGFLAALYAAEFPEHVDALILVAPAEVLVMPPPSGGLFEQVRARLPAEQQAEYAAFIQRYLDFSTLFSRSEAELQTLNAEFGPYYAAALGEPLPAQGVSGGWMVQGLYVSMGQRHDYRAALADVAAPTLVLHGADDLQPEAASRLYVDALPNARLEVIGQAGHFLFEAQPEAFAAAVGAFLESGR